MEIKTNMSELNSRNTVITGSVTTSQGVQILKLQLQFGDYACFIIRQPVMNGTAVADKIRLSMADNTDSSEVICHVTCQRTTVPQAYLVKVTRDINDSINNS